MARLVRLTVLAAALACAVVAAGCGNKQETVTQGATEGVYLDLDELKYQIQISRYLNANDIEDRAYLAGLPAGTAQPSGDETWFGVFLRVSNATDRTIAPANDFEIVDTQNNVYRPVPLDPKVNPFAYVPNPVPSKGLIPQPDSIASEGVVQGSLLLFKVKTASLQNRPLEFRLRRAGSGATVRVDLDV
jgi:hypothetical protein